MRGSELSSIIQSFPFLKEGFLGVFQENKLPRKIGYRQFAVIHRCIKDNEVGHWFAIFRPITGKLEIFDSLGAESNINKLKKYSKNFIFNSSHLQSDDSKLCGLFTIYFCFHRALNYDLLFEEIIQEIFSSVIFVYILLCTTTHFYLV